MNQRAWAIYLRVSDESKQHPERSVPRQRRRIETVLLAGSDLPVFREYTDYVSGLRVDRSDYQQLLTDARAGRFSHLALAEGSRFGRDLEEWTRAIRELIELGVRIKPADMPSLDVDTPDGYFIAVVMGGLAEREVRVLGQRAKEGMQEKLRGGGWPFKSPDGYLNKKREVSSGKWDTWVEADPDRDFIHSLIFDLYATGQYTLLTLAEELNQRGHRLPNGEPWSKQAVHRRLVNPFYVGRVESKTWGLNAAGNHRPLTSTEIFEKCQRLLREQATSIRHDAVRRRRQRYTYPLVGILWSAETGGPFHGTTCKGERCDPITYYRTRDKWQGKRIYVRAPVIHSQIPPILSQVRITAEVAEMLHALYRKEIDKEVERWFREGEPQRLRQRISELEGEQKTLLRFALRELVSEEQYKQEKQRIAAHIGQLQAKLSAIDSRGQEVASVLDSKLKLLTHLTKDWEKGTPQLQRNWAQGVFERIVINSEGQITDWTWAAPVEYLALINEKTTVSSGSIYTTQAPQAGLISNLFNRLFEELEPVHLLNHQPALLAQTP